MDTHDGSVVGSETGQLFFFGCQIFTTEKFAIKNEEIERIQIIFSADDWNVLILSSVETAV